MGRCGPGLGRGTSDGLGSCAFFEFHLRSSFDVRLARSLGNYLAINSYLCKYLH